MPMKICLSAGTDIGKARENNEDAFAICPDLQNETWECRDGYHPLGELGAVMIVADGMGGPDSGEVASTLAIRSIKESLNEHQVKEATSQPGGLQKLMEAVIKKANQSILSYVSENPDSIGMGTTVTMLLLLGTKAYIAWVGDSRGYVFNTKNGLSLLTKDHSYVQELVDKGEIKPAEAFGHPDGNIITRGLGDLDVSSEPDVIVRNVQEGDVYLLCSDGLCGYCQEKTIERALYRNILDMKACCKALIDMALEAGGEDNITVSLLSVIPSEASNQRMSFKARLRLWF